MTPSSASYISVNLCAGVSYCEGAYLESTIACNGYEVYPRAYDIAVKTILIFAATDGKIRILARLERGSLCRREDTRLSSAQPLLPSIFCSDGMFTAPKDLLRKILKGQ